MSRIIGSVLMVLGVITAGIAFLTGELIITLLALVFIVVAIVSFKNAKSEAKKSNSEDIRNAEELLKYKELFDKGAITEEEYKEMKSKLLNRGN